MDRKELGDRVVADVRQQEHCVPGGADQEDVEVRGTWNGAVVVTRERGEFVGLLRVGRRGARVVVPEPPAMDPKENVDFSAKK